MDKQKISLVALLVLVLAVALILGFKSGVTIFTKEDKVKPIPDPLDVTLDYYGEWLDYSLATTSSAYESDLFNNGVLTESAKQALLSARNTNQALDPFFCQSKTPTRIGGKVLFELPDSAEIIVIDKTPSSTDAFSQAIVSLKKGETAWNIEKITCSSGEVAPESEFSFEKEGYLLKSLPVPYKTGEWHLVFAENGVMGYVAPLLFSTTTSCSVAGAESTTCNTGTFTEGAAVKVTGNMLEEGASVIKLEIK